MDNDSAKMATSKGVIQGYAAQAAVDSKHQVIVAADALGSGAEQQALLPMIEKASLVRNEDTLITADAGYHSHANVEALCQRGVPAMIADGLMRKRDERFAQTGRHMQKNPLHDKSSDAATQVIKLFRPSDFQFDEANRTCICPAGFELRRAGKHCVIKGQVHAKFRGEAASCGQCTLRSRCLRHPERTPVRQVAHFHAVVHGTHAATEAMKRAIDSPRGRRLYSQRIGTVEPVFGNIRHNKRMNRFTVRGREKVNTQWHLYCLVHNIKKMAGREQR